MNDALRYGLALAMLPGVKAADMRHVTDVMGSARTFFDNPEGLMHGYSASELSTALRDADDEIERCTRHGIRIALVDTPDYPAKLGFCQDAPTALFVGGDTDLNSRHIIGIVGTRHATSYGIKVTGDIIDSLSKKVDDLLVVSGFAYGIDAAAHRAAIERDIPTVGVLAHGLDHIYPSAHTSMARDMLRRHKGALVTEYRYGATTFKPAFLARNRIIAGLSDCVLVVESACRGGALSTARCARDYGRDVFAIPGRIYDTYSAGCNDMICRNTALAVQSADDICAAMNWNTSPRARRAQISSPTLPLTDMTSDETAVYEALTHHGTMSLSRLAGHLSKPMSTMLPLLMAMEMKQIITGGMTDSYSLCKR